MVQLQYMKKQKSIEDINKEAGKKVVVYGKDILDQKIEFAPTGMLPLDAVIGGGMPRGRVVEIHGLQSTSKTSLCLAMIAKYQKDGYTCAFADVEYALNLQHAQNMGVDTDNLLIIQADHAEEIFETIESIVREQQADFIVIDSMSALVTRAEAEAETGKATMGGQARIISQALRKIIGPLAKSKTTLICINQLRMNLMGNQYDPYIASGGMAMRFYTSVILQAKRDKALVQGDNLIGYTIKIQVKKNKVGKPGGECKVKLLFDSGFSAEADLIDAAMKLGTISKEGNTYMYGDIKLGVGENRARKFLEDNPNVAEEIANNL